MKKLFLVILVVSAFFNAFSQSPQSFSYQMVVRDAGGVAMVNQTIGVQINIIVGPLPGSVVYSEIFNNISTNDFGIVNLAVGSSPNHTGDFTTITWGTANYFLNVGVDPTGGSTYADMGTTQLLSVPYALHAQTSADAFSGNYNDLNGVPVDVSTFNNDAGYITSPNDADADPTNELQVLSISNDTIFLANGGFVPMSGYLDTLWRSDGDKIYNTNNGNVGVGINDPNGKMVVKGDANLTDSDPLFEVKNRDGQTVFVVYPDSVRIFVGDDPAKTNKGVFAVSGRNSAKNMTNNYLWVTPDSTRIFLDSLNSKGGFAVKSFGDTLSKDFFSVYTDTNQTIDPSQKKILWYPAKSAFLSGKVLIEDPDSVGTNSVAIGFENKAKGDWSQAMGYQCYARGQYSMAIGKNSEANANNSYAFGDHVYAKAFDSYALGSKAIAEAAGSYAFGAAGRDTLGNLLGTYTKATGIGSYSFGAGCIASGVNSVAFGVNDSAIGINSVAMGAYSKAYGGYSFAMGFPLQGGWPVTTNVTSANHYAVALGAAVQANGTASLAMGMYSFANGANSIAIGLGVPGNFFAPSNYNIASGDKSVVLGYANSASGIGAYAIGYDNSAVGSFAVSFGNFLNSPTYSQFTVGRYNATITGNATAWDAIDPIFVVGNGTASGARSNALTILKNGNAGFGVLAPDATVDVVGTFQLGGGTSFSKYQAGTVTVGSNAGGGVKIVTITFPTVFTAIPKVVVTPRGVDGINDVFAFTTRNATTTTITVVIYRVDAAGGTWGQNLLLDWFAWQ